MSSPADEQVLGPVEAARLIFNTREPTAEQIVKVRGEMKRGTLHRSRQGGLTTTPEAVASYFATRAAADLVSHSSVAPARPSSVDGVTGAKEDAAVAGSVYQTMLKDYFLGIFLQRQSRQYPDIFQRAVLAGQIFFVLGILAIVIWVACDAGGMLSLGKSPQQQAVEAWIEEKHGPFEIVSIQAGPEETDLDVKFSYRAQSGKRIETRRVFRIVDGNVSLVVTE